MEVFMPGEFDRIEEKSHREHNYQNIMQSKAYRGQEVREEYTGKEYQGKEYEGKEYKGKEYMQPGNMYNSPKFHAALKMIKESILDEKKDTLFYDYLIQNASTKEEFDIIKSIRDDEIKHNMMFKRIYSDFTGEDVSSLEYEQVDYEKPMSYIEGVKMAHKGELKAMEKYRRIRESMPNRYYRDMLLEIMTDEMKHANWYNYILILNK